jgi:uncharacterized protein YpmS
MGIVPLFGCTSQTSWYCLIIWSLLTLVLFQLIALFAHIVHYQAVPSHKTFNQKAQSSEAQTHKTTNQLARKYFSFISRNRWPYFNGNAMQVGVQHA